MGAILKLLYSRKEDNIFYKTFGYIAAQEDGFK